MCKAKKDKKKKKKKKKLLKEEKNWKLRNVWWGVRFPLRFS
jgi:hypothetical protein